MSAITGQNLIGAAAIHGDANPWQANNPATGEDIAPLYRGATSALVSRACEIAWDAYDSFRETSLPARAHFLERVAALILQCGEDLVGRAVLETGLSRARIEGERGRTVAQLRMFASVVRDGGFIDARIDSALPGRTPAPRSDLRQRHIALGPVAVFGASNFPLAFSVAGGDTASAFAAGCPVVVKAHSAHPGTSELVGRAVQQAVLDCGLPEGVFSLLFGSGTEVGAALVANSRICAVGFTGSRAGGTALMAIAARRQIPIPVYAEMSSINPVYLFPGALHTRTPQLARDFVASLTLGAGQFCTNPGLVVAVDGPDLQSFIAAATAELTGTVAATMLTNTIHGAFRSGTERLAGCGDVETLARGRNGSGENQSPPALFSVAANTFIREPALHHEIFGAASLLVRCRDFSELCEVAESLAGQLTATVHAEPSDWPAVQRLIPALERKSGRIVVNGFPTGVEVSDAMVHGGPYPSTSDGRSTSVGSLAIQRFLRPVCYQDMPAALLPEALADSNPLQLWRRVNGVMGRH